MIAAQSTVPIPVKQHCQGGWQRYQKGDNGDYGFWCDIGSGDTKEVIIASSTGDVHGESDMRRSLRGIVDVDFCDLQGPVYSQTGGRFLVRV